MYVNVPRSIPVAENRNLDVLTLGLRYRVDSIVSHTIDREVDEANRVQLLCVAYMDAYVTI